MAKTPRPLPYTVATQQDVSIIGKKRLALRIVIDDATLPHPARIGATLRHAAQRARMGRVKRTKPDAVIVFGYAPGCRHSGRRML